MNLTRNAAARRQSIKKPRANLLCAGLKYLWRRVEDSNPRDLAAQLISSQSPSTTRTTLRSRKSIIADFIFRRKRKPCMRTALPAAVFAPPVRNKTRRDAPALSFLFVVSSLLFLQHEEGKKRQQGERPKSAVASAAVAAVIGSYRLRPLTVFRGNDRRVALAGLKRRRNYNDHH